MPASWGPLLRSRCAELLAFVAALLFLRPGIVAADLVETVLHVKPSIVAIGTVQRSRSPQFHLLGTGFAVGDGSLVATNSHVVPASLDAEHFEELIVVSIPSSGQPLTHKVIKVGSDPAHDLALLKMTNFVLPPLALDESIRAKEGQAIAFTGFPLVGILGLTPATHRGIVASITPIVLPQANSTQLNAQAVRRIREGAFPVLQLDATAYPGNSGSPLFDPDSGAVMGIVNMVFVKGSKESALTAPSGISYAIPVRYLKDLLSSLRK